MNIPIYKAEVEAGLEDAIKSNASVAFNSPVKTYIPSRKEEAGISRLLAFDAPPEDNGDQMDLYYLNSVLVSTGWNKNDDVFDTAETWMARKSPEDKQFNFMHDETDIIGHITGNIVIDQNGRKLSDQKRLTLLPVLFFTIVGAIQHSRQEWTKLFRRLKRINGLLAWKLYLPDLIMR
jgi:hypothetical protein